jgi:hypothetical protein
LERIIVFKKLMAMGLIVLFVLATLSVQAIAQKAAPIGHWVSTWTTALYAPNPMPGIAAEPTITDKTIRMIVRPSIGGQRLRVRFSNEFGTVPMTIASARIALTDEGSKIQTTTDRVLTFGGTSKITVPAGAPAFSDPVDIAVKPLTEVTVSIYLPGPTPAPSMHGQALHDAYVLGPGDLTSKTELPGADTKQAWYFLSGIDMWAAPSGISTLVAFGDSITQGYGAKSASYTDYPSQLAQRLAAQRTTALAIVNQGISGNRCACEERATTPAGLRAAARRGATAGGHLQRCRSSTMAPHRLRRGALHLPARRSRQNVKLFLRGPLATFYKWASTKLHPTVSNDSNPSICKTPFCDHRLIS